MMYQSQLQTQHDEENELAFRIHIGRSDVMLKKMRPNSILGIVPLTICLIEIVSVKSDELVGNKELDIQARRDDGRDESKSHPNNEHLASREHDLVQTSLECNTQDIPVSVVRSLNAMKGSGKRLREEKQTPQTPPIVSSLSDRKIK